MVVSICQYEIQGLQRRAILEVLQLHCHLVVCLSNRYLFGWYSLCMRPPAPALAMTDAQRSTLEVLAKSQTTAHREVQRAQVLLMAAEGLANGWISRTVGVTPVTVRSWRSRFEQEGLAKLGKVRPGRGRKPSIPQSKIDEIVELTRNSKPHGQTHWSVRSMAREAGVSPAQVQRIWAARGLKAPPGRDLQTLE